MYAITQAQQKSIFEGSESPDILISVSEESNSKLKSDMDCNQENEVILCVLRSCIDLHVELSAIKGDYYY